SIPHGPRGGGAGGGDRGAGLAAAPLESQQHRLRRRAQAGAGVGLARPPTSLGVGPLRGVPHGGRTTGLRRLFDSAVEAAVARAGGGVGGRTGRRPPARGALDWETTSLWSLDPVLMIVHD
ncbi:hypothetical protein EMIHUDRAFT_353029, partial [Emiliania huxleyi CCMP1516]|uniref:Uncharacterized protein n=2 Tax=Emiliania huxleyi TaxID=2903 RepID=A0A0D3K2S6_EMIH1